MNKKVSAVILAMLMLIMTACGATDNGNTGQGSSTESNTGNATPAMDTSLEVAAENGEETELTKNLPESQEPFVPDGVERTVIGYDGRIKVTDVDTYPFRAIAYMRMHFRCGCNKEGTGFMVGDDIMLTAGHCLCCPDHHQTVDYMTLYFGYVSDNDYFYKYDGKITYWYGTDFTEGYGMNWDYGYIKLDEDVGQYTGYYGIRAMSDEELEEELLYVAGYKWGELKYDYGPVSVNNEYVITYLMDTQPGNSGSPVSTYDNYVVAINVAENDNNNFGRRITYDLLNKILSLR